ncbi:MAG: glycosyltransferase family 10, partial [Oscillospiraceae bacterium]
NKVIYYMNEPSAVLPMYSTSGIKIIKNAYRYIMNWSDKVVDNDRIVKTSFGFIFAKLKNDVPTSDKNLLTMIAGCKTSKHPNELYSERVKIINYFESKHSKDFELYGTGWENAGLECYKGSCDSKHSVYEKFKFAVSLENQIGDTGDFSEKIFDCFNSGIVPIYLMAEQNKKYIPADTYIDYAQFKSVEDMESFLKDMTDEEYNGYLEAAQRYVNSPLKEIIEPEFYCKQVIKIIERDKENPYKLALYKKIYFSIFAAVTTVLSKLHINWEKSLY